MRGGGGWDVKPIYPFFLVGVKLSDCQRCCLKHFKFDLIFRTIVPILITPWHKTSMNKRPCSNEGQNIIGK